MDWKKVKKIDAHVHIIPEDSLSWVEGEWKFANQKQYIKVKDNPLPLGDGWNLFAVLMFKPCTAGGTKCRFYSEQRA